MVQKNDDDNCHDNNILMSDRRVDFGNFIRIKELLNSFKFLKSMLQPHYFKWMSMFWNISKIWWWTIFMRSNFVKYRLINFSLSIPVFQHLILPICTSILFSIYLLCACWNIREILAYKLQSYLNILFCP